MSTVANWILMTSSPEALDDEDPSDFVVRINQRIGDAGGRPLEKYARVDHRAGGYKAMEADVYILATNYFDYDEMVKIVREEVVKMAEPGVRVQLVHMGQDDEAWSFVDLEKGVVS